MRLIQRVRNSIAKRSGVVVTRKELASLGGSSQLSVVLRQLVDEGELVRLRAGVYAKARRDAEGSFALAASVDSVLDEVLKKSGISPSDASKEIDGKLWRVMISTSKSRIRRHLNVGEARIEIVSRNERGDRALDTLSRLPRSNVRKYVEKLARAHHITDERDGLHFWTEAVSRAAGDSVRLDSVGRLLSQLKQKHVISGIQMTQLMTTYLSEKKGASPRV